MRDGLDRVPEDGLKDGLDRTPGHRLKDRVRQRTLKETLFITALNYSIPWQNVFMHLCGATMHLCGANTTFVAVLLYNNGSYMYIYIYFYIFIDIYIYIHYCRKRRNPAAAKKPNARNQTSEGTGRLKSLSLRERTCMSWMHEFNILKRYSYLDPWNHKPIRTSY